MAAQWMHWTFCLPPWVAGTPLHDGMLVKHGMPSTSRMPRHQQAARQRGEKGACEDEGFCAPFKWRCCPGMRADAEKLKSSGSRLACLLGGVDRVFKSSAPNTQFAQLWV